MICQQPISTEHRYQNYSEEDLAKKEHLERELELHLDGY